MWVTGSDPAVSLTRSLSNSRVFKIPNVHHTAMWRYTQLPSKIWSGVLILRRQGEGNRKWRKQFCFKIFDCCSEPPSTETSQSSQSQRTRDEARFIESHNVSFEEEGKMKTRFGLKGRNRNSEEKSWNRGRRKKAGGGEGKFQEGVKSPIQPCLN